MRKFDVYCPSCKQSYHETTKLFKRDEKPNGSMFRLKEEFKTSQWSAFPEEAYIVGGRLECPGCGVLYVGHEGELIAKLVEQVDPMNERYLLARKLEREGKSMREIGEELGIAASTAHRILTKHVGRKKPC